MRKYRTLLRRLWRNAPLERQRIRVTWIDGETIYINCNEADNDKADGDKDDVPTEPAPPAPGDKPSSYNGDR